MAEVSTKLTTEATDLLSRKWAFFSGGITNNGSYIISLPDLNHEQVIDDTCSRLLRYLYEVVIELDLEAKFAFVIDRRMSKWGTIKPLLSFIQENFPKTSKIEKIFLLQPSGMFSSLFKLVSLNLDDTKIETLSSISDLHKKIDKSQLTPEFDGLLEFYINDWMDDRRMVENIANYIERVKTELEEVVEKTDALMSSYDETSQMSRSEVQERMAADTNSFQLLRDKIEGSRSNTKASLAYFLSQETMKSKLVHAVLIERLQSVLDELKTKCQGHFENYQRLMERVSKTKELNGLINEVIKKIENHLNDLGGVKVIGCSNTEEICLSFNSLRNMENSVKSLLKESETLGKSLEEFKSQDTASTTSEDQMNGEAVTTSITTMESSVDGSVTFPTSRSMAEQLAIELLERGGQMNTKINEFKDNLQFAFKQLEKTQEALAALDKACKWNIKGEALVSLYSLLLDEAEFSSGVSRALEDLESFQATSLVEVFSDLNVFQSDYEKVLDESSLKIAQISHSMCVELKGKVGKLVDELKIKRLVLVEKEEKLLRVQQVATSKESAAEGYHSLDSFSEDSYKMKPSVVIQNTGKHRKCGLPTIIVDSKIIPNMVMNDKNICQRVSIINSHSMSHGKNLSLSSLDAPFSSFDRSHPELWDIKQTSSLDDMEKYVPPRLKDDLLSIQPVPDSGTIRRKRSHVIQELIETEKGYTSDLRNVIEGYYDQFDNPELQHLIPGGLLDKRDILFGNIKDIYAFHSEIFLKSLEACECRPGDVGKCFVENKERLQLYSFYCQNKIQAEQLIEKVGDNNPFFKECQKRLNHPLPFSSYILKPVQRITKYHLLLKELVRMTTNQSETSDLKRAIISICDVLRYVNNSMHQLSITGFPGNLMDQGMLLMQGSLDVNVEKRKDRSPTIKQTFHKRQVFLYDKCILFCKKKDLPTGASSYVYKCLLKTDEVGPLVEKPRGGDEKRFELWSKNEVWSFTAPSSDDKFDWTEGIKKVLYEQMDHLRATHKRLHVDNTSQGKVTVLNPVLCPPSNEPDSLILSDLDTCTDT